MAGRLAEARFRRKILITAYKNATGVVGVVAFKSCFIIATEFCECHSLIAMWHLCDIIKIFLTQGHTRRQPNRKGLGSFFRVPLPSTYSIVTSSFVINGEREHVIVLTRKNADLHAQKIITRDDSRRGLILIGSTRRRERRRRRRRREAD